MCGSPVDDAKVLGRRLNTRQGLRPARKVGITTSVLRCRRCGLVFANPLPLPEHLAQHYELDPEEYWDPEYVNSGGDTLEAYVDTFRRLWRGQRTPSALDVGAGTGQNMVTLGQRGFDVYGLEPSASFRERALKRDELQPERLLHARVEEADFPEESFDFISLGAVLEHLPDPAASLERALRWLRRDGLMWVAVPSSRWLVARILNTIYRLQGLDYVTNISPMHSPFHLYEFTRDTFGLHGSQAGYRVEESRVVVCDTFAPRPLRGIAYRIMAATDTGMILEVWLRKTGAKEL
ncbi:MAG: hypothetical protein QOI98_1919 [Solirubrobacteraceae bacterium]|nr:hypothetical protein [Solirubrobacteraceae bacterium]